MNRNLRKRHFLTWCLLAILLPLGIAAGWRAVPCYGPIKKITLGKQEKPGLATDSLDTESYRAIIRKSPDEAHTAWQLEWINKKPMAVPTALIFRLDGGTNGNRRKWFTGRIEASGHFLFPVPEAEAQERRLEFVITDPVHDVYLDTLIFKL